MPRLLALDIGASASVSLLSDDLVKVFRDCVVGVGDDVMKFVTIALPTGLAIFALFKAVRLGMNFFNSIAN